MDSSSDLHSADKTVRTPACGLDSLHAFQRETLRVHALYLQGQLEYAGALVQEAQGRVGETPPSHVAPEAAAAPKEAPIRCHPVRLKATLPPDRLEWPVQPDAVCLVTDDGTPATAETVVALQARGWRVVVLSFPVAVVPGRADWSSGTSCIELDTMNEAHLQAQLTAVADTPVRGVVYFHPRFPVSGKGVLSFDKNEKALIRHAFLLAKYFAAPLNRAAHPGRSFFLTVTRLDGRLGLGDEVDFSPLGGGLFGLTKSLVQEWGSVFCRGLDLSPHFDPKTVANLVLAELHDPDLRLLEAGWDETGRWTLTCESGQGARRPETMIQL